ncbi:hypothetical protein BO71DRAFT_402728 [Aspergillus ellipticus CBS 707.79]|uniref:Uncharacterized protein n=1 Tax=Aspergillus ellipticus CBS 707.79 TaxID=1448320 RepID=A0A319EFK2_9EURO|nr:hypothetical protein BO71DRAFT_402728 [Aspergillus ellipticus CBS 707.79]
MRFFFFSILSAQSTHSPVPLSLPPTNQPTKPPHRSQIPKRLTQVKTWDVQWLTDQFTPIG